MTERTRSVLPADAGRFRRAAFEHYPRLRRYLRRLGLPADRADDVAQTAFLVALERLDDIVAGSERAFLYATAVRLVHGMRRRSRREILAADFDLDRSPSPTPEDAVHQNRGRELLEALLESIERESRAVFVRFEVDGLTIPEIARALAIPREAAICRLRRARRQFRARLRELTVL